MSLIKYDTQDLCDIKDLKTTTSIATIYVIYNQIVLLAPFILEHY